MTRKAFTLKPIKILRLLQFRPKLRPKLFLQQRLVYICTCVSGSENIPVPTITQEAIMNFHKPLVNVKFPFLLDTQLFFPHYVSHMGNIISFIQDGPRNQRSSKTFISAGRSFGSIFSLRCTACKSSNVTGLSSP